jgi:GMP synthase (glutamine-hydrolysing)
MTGHRPVLVVDFGAQYAQLIARRVREASVYSEIVPHTMPLAEMLRREPAAIILSGGPASVYADGAPTVDPALFEAGVPVLGICYGFQSMARRSAGRWAAPESASTAPPPSPWAMRAPSCAAHRPPRRSG